MEVNLLTEIVTAILLLIPFGWGWYILFRRVKKLCKTPLNYSVFALISIILATAYFELTLRIGFLLNNLVGNLIDYASTWMILLMKWSLWPVATSVLVLFTVYLTQRDGDKNTKAFAEGKNDRDYL